MKKLKVLALTAAFVIASSASFASDSPWLVRMRALTVIPDESSTITAIGGKADASVSVVPEVDISYFFTKHIATELILAVTPHDMEARNTTSGTLDLGSVWLLPPTLTLQYHFTPDAAIRPYVGAGINYTMFFNKDTGTDINTIKYENNFGYALQAGVDVPLTNNISFNFDVKKIYLQTDVTINGGAVRADVDLDPWLVGAGISYHF